MRKRIFCIAAAAVQLFAALGLGVQAAEDGLPDGGAPPLQDAADGASSDYAAYLAAHTGMPDAAIAGVIQAPVNALVTDSPVTVEVSVPEDGFYTVGLRYRSEGEDTADLGIGIAIDGAEPFAGWEELRFPRQWADADARRVDGLGNEFAPEQVPYTGYALSWAQSAAGDAEPYRIALTMGMHRFTLTPCAGAFTCESLMLGAPAGSAYTPPAGKNDDYDGEPIVMQAEEATVKSDYWLAPKSDDSSAKVMPHDPKTARLNYIGGNWKKAGETITWTTPRLKAGYYQLSFSYRQNALLNASSYRRLQIDGATPFAEADAVGFPYENGWTQRTFSDAEDVPYRIYLSEGTHEISLTVTLGRMGEVIRIIDDVVTQLGSLYMDMTVITGETVDMYRDYDLFKQIPDMEERIAGALEQMDAAAAAIADITGYRSSSYTATIKAMMQTLTSMRENKFTAHRHKSNYYTNYCSLSAMLSEMQDMPLDLDEIVLSAPGSRLPSKAGFWEDLLFSVRRFAYSFSADYNNISGETSDKRLTVWVNWGRDQAQVLNSLIQSSFTDMPVDVKLVNATMVQAVLSGKGPDCILQQPRTEPVNLAMRNVLIDLTGFDDCAEVLKRFQNGADVPYRYKEGLYALPDTQTFYMLFYRRDIFENLGLKPPETWDEFSEMVRLLARNNLDAWLPYMQITDMKQTNTGIGSLNLFSSLVLQEGLSLYTQDGRSTTLTTPEVVSVFNRWTDYYTAMKLPVTLNFYNRFRIGTCPVGIESYTLYTTLKATAPEIDGKWGMTPLPGTSKDGRVNRSSAGGGTGCAIMKSTPYPDQAWAFLKWWTSAETQSAYSANVEAVLGPTGRIAVSNVEALGRLSWEQEDLQAINTAWSEVREVPEMPGSYYISRSIDHSFWNVVNNHENPRNILLKHGREVDNEIARKWKQYENR